MIEGFPSLRFFSSDPNLRYLQDLLLGARGADVNTNPTLPALLREMKSLVSDQESSVTICEIVPLLDIIEVGSKDPSRFTQIYTLKSLNQNTLNSVIMFFGEKIF